MNKKTLNKIILLVSVSIAILISLQTWRIIESYRIYKDQIHKELDAALFNALKKETQIRYDKFKKEYGHIIDFNKTDDQSMENFMNMAISNMFPEGSYLKLDKLKEICSSELRKRKIRSKFQFEIEDLFRGTIVHFPNKANYIPAAQSIQYKVGSVGHSRISLSISNIDSYIFSNLKWSLGATLILILFNAGCLFYMLYTIIHQKQVSEMRNDFVSNMTHEFKTPIATISAANEAITTFKSIGAIDRIDKYIDISKNETKKLNNLVEEILNISVYDKKEFDLKLENVDINELIKDNISKFKLKNEDFHFDYSGCDIKPIMVDKFHFQNAITNLIDNAIKYSESVKIVEINLFKEKNKLALAIKDYGKGITKDQQRYIFDKFYRAHTGDIHQVKGFGLGLSYVKKIIDKHHGTISLKSQVGKGSEFFVYLPINQEIS